jgi:hypothetical protein
LGLWVGCESAGLLREQEQETTHGLDLSLEAIDAAKSGAMASGVEVVRYCRKTAQEFGINFHGPFENESAECLVEFMRLR